MIQVSIKNIKSGLITHGSSFPTLEAANEWIDYHKSIDSWGKLERTIPQSECSEEELSEALELIPEVIDETGFISPALARLPQTFEVIIEDITAQVEQEKINAEALAFLAATDWMVIRALEKGLELSAEFKAERQAARDRIIR